MSDDIESADPTVLRETLVDLNDHLNEITAAHAALVVMAKRAPMVFDRNIAQLVQMRDMIRLQRNMARRDYVDQVLVPLADEAYKTSDYPLMHADAVGSFGVSGQTYYSNNVRRAQEAGGGDSLTFTTEYDRDTRSHVLVSAYDAPVGRLVDIESFLVKRVRDVRLSAERKAAAKRRNLTDAQYAVMEAIETGETGGVKAGVVRKLTERGLLDEAGSFTELGRSAFDQATAKRPKKPELSQQGELARSESPRPRMTQAESDQRARDLLARDREGRDWG